MTGRLVGHPTAQRPRGGGPGASAAAGGPAARPPSPRLPAFAWLRRGRARVRSCAANDGGRRASPKRSDGGRWRLILLWGLIPTLVAAGLSLYRPASLVSVEHIVYDTMLRSAPTRPPSGQIVIVDIDERSLSAIGQWPWRRDVMGRLIGRLTDLGASIVALDIIFAEADRHEVSGGATDAALADTLRTGRVVLGYALTFDGDPEKSTPCVQHPLGLPIIRRGDESADVPFFQATAAICNLPTLTQAASASGFLNAAPDPDGILRRVPLLMGFNGRVYPSLAAAAIAAATAVRDSALHVVNVNTSWLALDTREEGSDNDDGRWTIDDGRSSGSPRGINVPLDGKSNLLLRYRGPKRTFPYVSAVDVLESKLGPDTFQNKLVFIGTTALGTREVVATPLDTLFAGVEVQATVADNLLQQDFIHRPEHGVALETQAVLVLGILAALAVGRLGLAWGAVVAAACVAAVWIGAVSLMSADGRFLSPLFPTVGLTSALAGMTVARYTM
jgi:adenylate cyclase